ncbi:MAG: SRPBCC family protein [Silvibacterium sp.]
MNHIAEPMAQTGTTTRRRMIGGIVVAIGALVARPEVWGAIPQAMKETPATAANKTRTSLHQEIDFKASPQRVYEVLLDSKLFTAFSGMPAEIDPKAGGAFTTFGGQIEGRTVELVANQRIVQAWRPTHWDPGVYSIVRFELKPQGSGATVVLDHTGFPEGDFDHLTWGWNAHYWEPLKKFFA